MARLEDLKPGSSIRGVLPGGGVTVVSVQWFGSTPTLAGSGCRSRAWCGRRDSNPHSHREADFLTTSAFAAAVRRSWSGLSLRHGVSAEGATHPVSTPSLLRGFGSGLAWGVSPLAFPDFERFYSVDFPTGTPTEVCCVYRFRHVRIVMVVPQRAMAR